jgi:hypothetical protein
MNCLQNKTNTVLNFTTNQKITGYCHISESIVLWCNRSRFRWYVEEPLKRSKKSVTLTSKAVGSSLLLVEVLLGPECCSWAMMLLFTRGFFPSGARLGGGGLNKSCL